MFESAAKAGIALQIISGEKKVKVYVVSTLLPIEKRKWSELSSELHQSSEHPEEVGFEARVIPDE